MSEQWQYTNIDCVCWTCGVHASYAYARTENRYTQCLQCEQSQENQDGNE